MTFDVLLIQKNRKYFAHIRQWPEIIGEGETEEKALAQAQNELKALLTGGRVVQLHLELDPSEHPWHQFAGMFEDDSDWDEFQAAIQKESSVTRYYPFTLMFILDTDHISLFQRNHPEVATRILSTPHLELATTVITVEEQLRGRLDRIRQARDDESIVRAYSNLKRTFDYFQTINVIDYDNTAQEIFNQLRANKLRISTQDLRIAAIVLSQNAVLVTRNQRDFGKIPNLKTEDWSLS